MVLKQAKLFGTKEVATKIKKVLDDKSMIFLVGDTVF